MFKKSWQTLAMPPRYLATSALLLMVTLLGTAFFEFRNQKSEIQHVMHEEATLLVRSLSMGAQNAIAAYDEITALLTEKLLASLRLIDRLDQQNPLTAAELTDIANENGLFRVNQFDAAGSRTISSLSARRGRGQRARAPSVVPVPRESLEPILTDKTETLVFGVKQSRYGIGMRFAVALARSRGGAWVANVDADQLLEFRQRIGIGKLIQQIGADVPGVAYIIWQDTLGIVSATPSVAEAKPFSDDAFLQNAVEANSTTSRFTQFADETVFEVVHPFTYQDNEAGLIRIGLETDHLDAALSKLQRRLGVFLGLLFVGGLILISLFAAKQNEATLSRAYQQIQTFSSTVLDEMAEAVLVLDSQGRITLLNQAAEILLQQKQSQAKQQHIASVLPNCSTPLMGILSDTHNGGQCELICEIQGRPVVLAASLSRLPGNETGDEGIVAVLRDLTEQRALELRVRRNDKLNAMGKLASGVAHEIRNPLNAIGILAQRLGMEFTPTEDQADYRQLVQTVVSQVQRVNEIVQQFLRFARPPELNRVHTSLSQYLIHLEPLLQGVTEDHRVSFRLDVSCDTDIEVDRGQMQQVLLNLVRNASEAMSPGEEVVLSCTQEAQHVVLTVTDTGHGISPEDIPRIFDLYFTSKPNGTGIGLSIVNQIIQAHDGNIEVESQEGKGSSFRITLPLVNPTTAEEDDNGADTSIG